MKQLFLFLVAGLCSTSVSAVTWCDWGQDPLDPDLRHTYEGPATIIPAGSVTRMRGANGIYKCKLAEDQPAVDTDGDGEPDTFLICGNKILEVWLPQQQTTQSSQSSSAPRNDDLLQIAKRPMGQVQIVDGSNPRSRATETQFQLHATVGVGANWHFGLPGVKIQQHQNQSQSASVRGGSGGSSSTKTIVENGGGNGGNGGGPGDFASPPENGGNGGGPKDFASGPVDFASGND